MHNQHYQKWVALFIHSVFRVFCHRWPCTYHVWKRSEIENLSFGFIKEAQSLWIWQTPNLVCLRWTLMLTLFVTLQHWDMGTLGWSKNPVSSQTDKLMAGTKFSDYLGLKHYKKAKKIKKIIHLRLAQRPQSFNTYHAILYYLEWIQAID